MLEAAQLVEGAASVRELWQELGASMRALRIAAGVSLRQAELASGRGRGTLSQAENGKARPSRDLVEWYDATFGGDGLLLSIYAEARVGPLPPRLASSSGGSVIACLGADGVDVVATYPPAGHIVPADVDVDVSWTLRNAGALRWRERQLRRIGPRAGARTIASPAAIDVPDTAPGSTAVVKCVIRSPASAGTAVAYWQMYTADEPSAVNQPVVAVLLTVV